MTRQHIHTVVGVFGHAQHAMVPEGGGKMGRACKEVLLVLFVTAEKTHCDWVGDVFSQCNFRLFGRVVLAGGPSPAVCMASCHIL